MVLVQNTGSNPAFLTHVNIESPQRAFYADHDFFWLGPGETRKISIQVLWPDTEPPQKTELTVKAWNAKARQIDLAAGSAAER